VVIAEDDIAGDPIPTDASIDCEMGWCDLCQGTRPASDAAPQPCTHSCHTAAADTRTGAGPQAQVRR